MVVHFNEFLWVEPRVESSEHHRTLWLRDRIDTGG